MAQGSGYIAGNNPNAGSNAQGHQGPTSSSQPNAFGGATNPTHYPTGPAGPSQFGAYRFHNDVAIPSSSLPGSPYGRANLLPMETVAETGSSPLRRSDRTSPDKLLQAAFESVCVSPEKKRLRTDLEEVSAASPRSFTREEKMAPWSPTKKPHHGRSPFNSPQRPVAGMAASGMVGGVEPMLLMSPQRQRTSLAQRLAATKKMSTRGSISTAAAAAAGLPPSEAPRATTTTTRSGGGMMVAAAASGLPEETTSPEQQPQFATKAMRSSTRQRVIRGSHE